MHKWYVVHVISGQEKKVKRALEEGRESQGMTEMVQEILLPTENVAEVKRGEQRVSEKRIWPGYLLVKMDLNDDAWMYVRNTSGVLGFLGGEKPTPLPQEDVDQLIQELEEKKHGVVHKHKIQKGDRVKITDGVFANFIGIVENVMHEKGRLSVMVTIFGRETRVDDLEFWQIEQIAAESEGT
jgi:transcriptional antiterminator NusG